MVNHDTIKVRTVDRRQQDNDRTAFDVDTTTGININNRLDLGSIGGTISGIQGIESQSRGIELREAYTNTFLTGEYRQDIWQMDWYYTDDPSVATIWPYWGKDENEDVILGYGLAFDDFSSEHYFDVSVSTWGIPRLSGTWRITTTELRMALAGETQWRDYVLARQPNLASLLGLTAEDELPANNTFLKNGLDAGLIMPKEIAAASNSQADLADNESLLWDRMSRVYQQIYQYATIYFGKKYMIKLPYLCVKVSDETPYTLELNWQIARDGGWTSGSVLGLNPGSIYLEHFRQDDGKIAGFVGFESLRPLDLSGITDKDAYIQINPYLAYVKCQVDDILQVSPGDWRAIITLPGTVSVFNPHPYAEKVRGLWAMMKIKYGNVSIDALYNISKRIGADKIKYSIAPLPQIPIKAAVPLQSTRLVYGPWGATLGDLTDIPTNTAGKTDYQRNTEYSPWTFNGMSRMNDAANAWVIGRLSDHYVVEQGSISVPESPIVSLGDPLFSGGPLVTDINVNVQPESAPIITSYTMRTYTPTYGRLAQHYIAIIKRNGQWARKSQRIFRLWALEKFGFIRDSVYSTWLQRSMGPVRYNTGSSLDMLVGENITDHSDLTCVRSNIALTELRKGLPELSTNYAGKSCMDIRGLLRPFSTSYADFGNRLPTFEDSVVTGDYSDEQLKTHTYFYSKEQVPPITCSEHHLPIVMETLSPFLSEDMVGTYQLGSSKGHDIEYIARDAVYPTHLNIRHPSDNYSTSHRYRGVALRGPLVIAGWGYDIDNKPVPNASPAYPNNAHLEFEENWLRKPHTWPCGPVDLRWDYERKVWTSPSSMKIVKVQLEGPSIPWYTTYGTLVDEDEQVDRYGSHIEQKVRVGNVSGNVIPPGAIVLAWYDTHDEVYYIISEGYWLYLVNVIGGMRPYGTGVGLIVGEYNGYSCNLLLTGVYLTNTLAQPICPLKYAYAYIYSATPVAYETDDCGNQMVTSATYYAIVLQAQFDGLDVVTNVELVENADTQQDNITCYGETEPTTITCDGMSCYVPSLDVVVECEVDDDWVEYMLCICKRKIYLQTAWSPQVCDTDTYEATPSASQFSCFYDAVDETNCDDEISSGDWIPGTPGTAGEGSL